jgi:hypothetical protein
MGTYKVKRRRGSHIFQIIGSQAAARLSALRAIRAILPQKYSWYSLIEAESTPGPQCEELSKFNKFNHLIQIRIRDIPACSIASQPTTLLPAQSMGKWLYKSKFSSFRH